MTAKNKSKTFSQATQLFMTFLKLGCSSFGGPAAHIGYFHREFVEKKAWLSNSQFSQLLAICQFLPGPASSQLGFSIGLHRLGALGAVLAFIAFTLPSALIMFALAFWLPDSNSAWGEALISGLKIVALVVVADAVLSMSKKLCAQRGTQIIALLSLCALLIWPFYWTQIIVIIIAAGAGYCFFSPNTSDNFHTQHSICVAHSTKIGISFALLFFTLLAIFTLLNFDNSLYFTAQTFYNAGALVFGGGHVVLPLLENATVANGAIDETAFIAGYGAAQAIPGPLFTFSAYLGALIPSQYPSLVTAVIAVVFIFLPGFILVIAVLPLWKTLAGYSSSHKIIAGINASVVGILAAALYDPIFTQAIVNKVDLAIAIFGFTLLTILRLSPIYLVLGCSSIKIALNVL
ncbi:chromate efflux transporter [Sessilibacter sp. MAH4]